MSVEGESGGGRKKGRPFSKAVVRELQNRAANHCSNPACRQLTATPHSDRSRGVVLGEAAHIHARSPGGSRFDEHLSEADTASARNGIWLCRQCHAAVDRDPSRFPPRLLLEWREQHDAWVLLQTRLGTGETTLTGSPCPNCGAVLRRSLLLCEKCFYAVYWTATREELALAWKIGVRNALMGTIVAFVAFPALSSWALPRPLPFGLGLGLWTVPFAVVAALVGGMTKQRHVKRFCEDAAPRVERPPGH